MYSIMNEFEKNILEVNKEEVHTNTDEFLTKLHSRIQASNTNRQTLFASSAIAFTVLFLIITQFGAPDIQADSLYDEEIEMLFETDFWTIKSDSLDHDSSYTYDIAYFLLQEGYVWDTIELLEELEIEKEISL